MKFFRVKFAQFKKDYRHIICTVISLLSLAAFILFPNGLPRLAEAVRDFFISIGYYFVEIFTENNNPVPDTINELQKWKFAREIWKPIKLFPYTWEEFQLLWETYWDYIFSKSNFKDYTDKLGEILTRISKFLLVILPLVAVIILRVNSYKTKRCNVRNLESKQLKIAKKFQFNVIYPIIAWCKDFVCFVKQHSNYYIVWLVLWCLHFNIFSIVISLFAYYFYFVSSWNIISLFTQGQKLLVDLTPVIRFHPGIVWLILGAKIYNYICRSMAFSRLYYAERCNRAFLRGRGVLTTVYGEMGIGKTQMITAMGISAEIEQFDMAFDIMIEKDMQFPNFPWQIFRDALRKKIDEGVLVDSKSCRVWVNYCRFFYDRITARSWTYEEYQKMRIKHKLFDMDYTFGYDFTHYRSTYNDELKITHLFEALEDYACAYLKFTVKTTLLFANYSIRLDSILSDLGNMPSRDNDFLNRDPEYQEAYSHHAHIIDFDMLRLGKKVIKNNPKARRAPSGVIVVTEMDKEFKNMQELKEVKRNIDETNQKNDLHDACLMMIRHADVIANRTFIRIIADLQRPEAWGSGGRELGEIVYISDKSELSPALPFFSPYWLFQGLFSWIKSKWDNFNDTYIVNRSDNTLLVYFIKNVIAAINNHYDKINGLFGIQTLSLEIQSGRMDGEVKKEKWRLITKKDRSRRYRTSCLQAVFDTYEPNTMHIDDFIMYAGEVGTQEENELQNSYFQNDIKKMKQLNYSNQENDN